MVVTSNSFVLIVYGCGILGYLEIRITNQYSTSYCCRLLIIPKASNSLGGAL